MFFIIKFLISFTLSFLILSFPVKENRPFFYYVHQAASPYTDELFTDIKVYLQQKSRQTVSFGKQLFTNADPKDVPVRQRVSSKDGSEVQFEAKSMESGDYTREERELLQRILKNGHPSQ